MKPQEMWNECTNCVLTTEQIFGIINTSSKEKTQWNQTQKNHSTIAIMEKVQR
jgi:hypothetical protein